MSEILAQLGTLLRHEPGYVVRNGSECIIACDCGVESRGRTWEDAGRERDAHLEEEKRAGEGGGV